MRLIVVDDDRWRRGWKSDGKVWKKEIKDKLSEGEVSEMKKFKENIENEKY